MSEKGTGRGRGRGASSNKRGSSPSAASTKSTANTGAHVYLDTFNDADFCAADKKRIDDKCKEEEPKDKEKKAQEKAKRKKHLLGGLKDRIGDAVQGMDKLGRVGYTKDVGNAWMNDHCDGMWVKPWHTSLDSLKGQLEQVKKEMEGGIWQVAKDAAGAAGNAAKEGAIDWGKKTAAKEAAGAVAAGATAWAPPVALAIEAGTQVWAAAGTLNSAGTIIGEGAGAAAMGIEKYEEIKDQIKKLESMLDPNAKSTEVWEDAMTGMAAANACLRARKCKLVPYKATENPASKKGDGCCPGQTGHHVIPDAAANSCPGYNHDEAPTICLEGTSNNHGSHGLAHQNLKKTMADYNGAGQPPKPISFGDMQKKSLDALGPMIIGCSRTCLIAQLKAYYGDCKTMVAHSGTSGTPKAPGKSSESPTATE